MAIVLDNADVQFYESVHRALELFFMKKNFIDQRSAPRHDYVCRQLIAESPDWSLPVEAEAFQEVLCYDLSMGGFSFLTMAPPAHQRLIVRLAGDAKPVYMRAEVVHVAQVPVEESIWQKVGCRFVGRES